MVTEPLNSVGLSALVSVTYLIRTLALTVIVAALAWAWNRHARPIVPRPAV